jgi:hypothetical protein
LDGFEYGWLLHVGIGDASSDGLEDGLSLGVELYQVRIDKGSLVGFQDGSSLGVELGIDDGSTTQRRWFFAGCCRPRQSLARIWSSNRSQYASNRSQYAPIHK